MCSRAHTRLPRDALVILGVVLNADGRYAEAERTSCLRQAR